MNEVAELRRQVEDLTLRVAAIEEGFVVDHERYLLLGFTRSEAILVALLMKRGVVSLSAMMAVLYGAAPADAPDHKIVDIFVHRIRKRLSGFGLPLLTRRGARAWYLHPQTKAAIRHRLGAIEGDRL